MTNTNPTIAPLSTLSYDTLMLVWTTTEDDDTLAEVEAEIRRRHF